MHRRDFLAGALAWAALPQEAAGLPDLECEIAFPNLKFYLPVGVACPPDGTDRLFVVGQIGYVYVFENRPDVASASIALDIRSRLHMDYEKGLLGFAFHPKFKENRFVFLLYTVDKPPRSVLSRFTMNPERTAIVPESEKILLEMPQPRKNHIGGNLNFGPDGFLYVAKGNGGFSPDPVNPSQNLQSHHGKFLRIDVNSESEGRPYAIPPDNPFVGRADALPEIWAYGLRNPWGFSFDPKSGELWTGDVGESSWEEINLIRKGRNYGSGLLEGKLDPSQYTRRKRPVPDVEDPVVVHDRKESLSVTGGRVCRGSRLKGLEGAYVYGDFCNGNIWALRWDGRQVAAHRRIAVNPMKQITSFGEDRDGELLFTSFDRGPTQGRVYRFKPV